MRYWTSTDLPVEEVRRQAMRYFGKEAVAEMALVTREPNRLLFSDPSGDLAVEIGAGRPNTVAVITSHWHGQAQEFLQRLAGGAGAAIHYETASDRPAQDILQQARTYFGTGPEGLGLALSAEQPQSLEFSGGGGSVTVAVQADGRPQVQVTARQWTYQAEQFTRQVSRER